MTTPIGEATLNGHKEVVKLLIEADAEVNPPHDTCWVSPLFLAAEKGHLEVVKVLLDNSARVEFVYNLHDITPRDLTFTPLGVAIRERHE